MFAPIMMIALQWLLEVLLIRDLKPCCLGREEPGHLILLDKLLSAGRLRVLSLVNWSLLRKDQGQEDWEGLSPPHL